MACLHGDLRRLRQDARIGPASTGTQCQCIREGRLQQLRASCGADSRLGRAADQRDGGGKVGHRQKARPERGGPFYFALRLVSYFRYDKTLASHIASESTDARSIANALRGRCELFAADTYLRAQVSGSQSRTPRAPPGKPARGFCFYGSWR